MSFTGGSDLGRVSFSKVTLANFRNLYKMHFLNSKLSQTSCTVDTQLGGECHNKVVNLQSQVMIENAPVYPGLLYWNKGNWKCQNLLVTAKLLESEDYSKFEVLVKA